MPTNSVSDILKTGPLALSLFLISHPAFAADPHGDHHYEAVVVTASGTPLDEVVQPVKIIDSTQLMQSSGSTLGDVLDGLPGISNGSFGPGVGRPVVRGLSGNRVKIAINGSDAADVSAMSSDHSPMVDVANAQQVEVLYGPATLLFGSGAIGGVINLSDDRFHSLPLIGKNGEAVTEGNASYSTSSADQGLEVKAKLDAGYKNWVFHLDGFSRSSEDFESALGVVQNTDTQGQGFNLGSSYIYGSGYTGLAVSVLDYEYGVPNEENDRTTVAPSRTRIDWVNETYLSGGLFESVKAQLAYNDYEHDEVKNGEVEGIFQKESMELKTIFSLSNGSGFESKLGLHLNSENLALCHDHLGCDAIPDFSGVSWDGTKGSFRQETGVDGIIYEFPHATPMPETETLDLAGFWLASKKWSGGKQEYALRVDQRTITADPVSVDPTGRQEASYYDDKDFLSVTASAGWSWLTDGNKFGLALGRTERAPSSDEIYWNGDHHATFSYQLHNPDLDKETAYTVDVTWQKIMDKSQLDMAVYYYDFDGFIYNDLKVIATTPSGGDPFHGNTVYRHEQEDAYLTGFELSWQKDLENNLSANLALDHAVGRLKEGDVKPLPRIPPASLLAGISWQWQHYLAKADVRYYSEQDKVSANESTTDAYATLNALLAYEMDLSDYHVDVHLKLDNILDESGRNHVSYLKEYSPIVGRNVTLDVGFSF